MVRLRHIATALVTCCSLLAVPAAVAKDFGPGDLRVCGRDHCVVLRDAKLLRTLSAYSYGREHPERAARVRIGAPGFALRFRGGQPVGVVASPKLDRFRATGFDCGRFERGRWYRFPTRAAAALRKLTAKLRPLRVTPPPRSC